MNDKTKMLKVEAILFDVGDTLIDTSTRMKRALYKTAEYLESKNIISEKEKFITIYEIVDKEIQGPRINHLYSDPRIIIETAKRLNISPSLYLVGAFLSVYRRFIRKSIRKSNRLIKLFKTLKNEGFKIGIVTDGSTVEQIEQLYRLGILEYIDALITSEELDVEKPNALLFRKMLNYLSVNDSSNAVMVGDDLKRDIAGAKKIGINTIWVTNYSAQKNVKICITPDIVVKSVDEITKHIRPVGGDKNER
ncbi:MAG: HAD-IA family hydrolase [Thermoplasmata archaeon]|nr:HAD-IA family hydrolase [Thermoplasmata archaeon]